MIDLDRLREALSDWDMDQAVSVHPVFAVGVAVLAAPTVWICIDNGTNRRIGEPEFHHREYRTPHFVNCGWVALVPITGEGQ